MATVKDNSGWGENEIRSQPPYKNILFVYWVLALTREQQEVGVATHRRCSEQQQGDNLVGVCSYMVN